MSPSEMKPHASLFIGTAGWSVPRIHADKFPAAGTHLQRYAAVLSCAEINTSFYRPHRLSTYSRWAASVPEGFRFSVKVPKAVTHADWNAVSDRLDAFLDEVSGLGPKLGPLLIQLPPSRRFDLKEAGGFFETFRRRITGEIVVEPRHPSWFTTKTESLLMAHVMARVAADPALAPGADNPGGSTDLSYFRLHGSPDFYRSSYLPERVSAIASRMVAHSASRAIWCIFDNTASYAATGDAIAMQRLLQATAQAG